VSVTKKEARDWAERSTRYGHSDKGNSWAATCKRCGTEIRAPKEYKRNATTLLRAAIVSHIVDYDECDEIIEERKRRGKPAWDSALGRFLGQMPGFNPFA